MNAELWAGPGDPALSRLERAHGLPRGLLAQIWLEECSGRKRCPDGADGELGEWQIKVTTASEVGCVRGWYETRHKRADCAARILAHYISKCGGRLMEGIGRYNSGKCIVKGTYSQPVYMSLL